MGSINVRIEEKGGIGSINLIIGEGGKRNKEREHKRKNRRGRWNWEPKFKNRGGKRKEEWGE